MLRHGRRIRRNLAQSRNLAHTIGGIRRADESAAESPRSEGGIRCAGSALLPRIGR
jgi:hypothetical protein